MKDAIQLRSGKCRVLNCLNTPFSKCQIFMCIVVKKTSKTELTVLRACQSDWHVIPVLLVNAFSNSSSSLSMVASHLIKVPEELLPLN